MQTNLRGRDLISLREWTREEIETVLDVATDLKRQRALGQPHPYLRDKVLAMLFFYSSTRTRASFEAGMAQLGGHAQFIESRTTQIAHGDTAREIGEILGRYNDGCLLYTI
jgi:ornithine carbamoyltransferase